MVESILGPEKREEGSDQKLESNANEISLGEFYLFATQLPSVL